MKKTLYFLLALLVAVPALSAQEKTAKPARHLTPYGFIRTLAIFDSRVCKAGSEDLFFYMPLDKDINLLDGRDMNYNPSFKMSAITTRLGFNFAGYEAGSAKLTGKVEADFYLMNKSTASLRLRQAYVNVLWDGLGQGDGTISLKIGQAWTPLAADMPYAVNIESGTPFNPFGRNPQIMMEAGLTKRFSLTAGAVYPMQFLPTGPDGASENYVKYGLVPELYAGINYKSGSLLARLGADFISLRPRWNRMNDRVSFINPMLYLQYASGNLKVNAKTIYASGGDHLRLMSGYALYDTSDPYNYKYTPLHSTVSYVSFSYGKKWQVMGMIGYMKALGTSRDLPVSSEGFVDPHHIYYFASGFKNIDQLFRATPTIAYNAGKLTVALEYDATLVQYGDVKKLGANALSTVDPHGILNHRILGVVKFSF